jgi:hypothetical protein
MKSEKADESTSYIVQLVTASGKPIREPFDKGQTANICTWLSFFTATNAFGLTKIPSVALNEPIRLAKTSDGSVKVNKNGRLVKKADEEISKNLKLIKDNLKC